MSARHFSVESIGTVTLMLFAALIGGVISDFVNFDGEPADWLSVSHVYVMDAPYGEDHEMLVDRTIHRNFQGRWFAEISKDTGEYACHGLGQSLYQTDDSLPNPLYLYKWWAGINDPVGQCIEWPLPVGCYKVHTEWVLLILDKVDKKVANTSNTFCVTERDDLNG